MNEDPFSRRDEGALGLGLGLTCSGLTLCTQGSSHLACRPGGGQACWALWGGPWRRDRAPAGNSEPEGKPREKRRHGAVGSRHELSVFERLLYAGI